MQGRTFTEAHVEKLIALAFLRGQEFAMSKMLKQVNILIGDYNDTQSKDPTYHSVTKREATNSFLTTFS
jgi:aspartate/tyrosine/aromatic aminotransferase